MGETLQRGPAQSINALVPGTWAGAEQAESRGGSSHDRCIPVLFDFDRGICQLHANQEAEA